MHAIGAIALNIVFILYLIVYCPQLIHNRKKKNLTELSLLFHAFLYCSYFSDFIYGVASQMPWQYIFVSSFGVYLLTVQAIQLIKLFISQSNYKGVLFNMLALLMGYGLLLVGFFHRQTLSPGNILFLGSLARGLGMISPLPQIVKNYKSKQSQGLNIFYLYFSLAIALLDGLAAWGLDWELPNKIAPMISLLMVLILISQHKIYQKKQFN